MDSVLQSVFAGFGAFLLLHVVIWRATPSNAPRIVLLTGLAGLGMAVSGLTAVAVHRLQLIEVCAVLWMTGFLLTFYFFVYAGVARSVSVTLLSRLLQSRTEAVEVTTLLGEYEASTRFHDRVRLMHHAGLLRVTGDLVSLTPMGHALSRGVRMLTRLTCGELQG